MTSPFVEADRSADCSGVCRDADNEDHLRKGQDAFHRYLAGPEAFLCETGAPHMEAAFQLERMESEKLSAEREEIGADLLDSLVHMPVENDSHARPLMAEQMTYAFEQSIPVEDTLQPPLTEVAATRERDRRGMNSDVRQKEVEEKQVEEKQAVSEIASTHGSESAVAVRFVDRVER